MLRVYIDHFNTLIDLYKNGIISMESLEDDTLRYVHIHPPIPTILCSNLTTDDKLENSR